MQRTELVSVDGLKLDAAVHSATSGLHCGVVLLVHGIAVDMDEGGGMFVRLADRLAGAGFDVVRFSFRGHGGSDGTQRGVTIAGECLDLQAAIGFVRQWFNGPMSIVAASFGAVSTMLSLSWLEPALYRLVLWNPVLDLRHTFLEPELAWGVENFGPDQQKVLQENGFLRVDGEFELGRVLFMEFAGYRPSDAFGTSRVPALVVHGDRDSSVSYSIAAEAVRTRPEARLHTVAGSDHGFDGREREDEAIGVTVDWLVDQSTRS
ncbi:alpha/beta fold hydrolase [Nocardia sp. CDC159]|uniref:Alpha/beta fold hydrolase n=1 Tax=Nocardia pulmonis TaxID=2951408 RepID=A0A9X2E7A5_9NOCA|nr:MULTISPECIES: alpha/beta fold hydrolase [Nocardia]MCM6774498.1 alpha/beta fold hydrolase [Nocardia pulmonis]MCM6787436.1 alpha/beta fold hydrolase [Nocardia sp. CDC159]